MNCPIHGDFKGLICRECFENKSRNEALTKFLSDPDATFKGVRRGKGDWHAIVPGMGNFTLCGKEKFSLSKATGPYPKSHHKEIGCKECKKIGWPEIPQE
jgi:hypothetical protein